MNKNSAVTDPQQLASQIAEILGLKEKSVLSAIELLADGNTVPFISRYRKEATGGLDEIALRAIEDALERAQTLAARKTTVLNSIDEQGALTEKLRSEILGCDDIKTLEAIYLPFKPRRRSRATAAREKGLQPLADILLQQERIGKSKNKLLDSFVDPAKDVPDRQAALQGALDIAAEQWADTPEHRQWLSGNVMTHGKVRAKVKRGKASELGKFEQYADRSEPIRRLASHRLLAMLRGEAEGILRVDIEIDEERNMRDFARRVVTNRDFEFHRELLDASEDSYKRLLFPAVESATLSALKEKSDEEAIEVFAKNLHELLMSPPAGPRVTIGIDPGFRTGCKVAVVDATGKFLENATIYPTPPRSDTKSAAKVLIDLIERHDVELIAIGNGTASRETDSFVESVIQTNDLAITKVTVSESGASIYSASEIAAAEFPDLDVTVRGAISIARRLQDPLAELVKTDPKSIGVGQYQHDVNQPRLRKCLDRVVESCVNNVGVDVNMASVPLLSHVAGIGPKLAEKIVSYRNSNGRFRSRRDLLQVEKLGKKAFQQAAGFLRIRDCENPLDNSAVHPESYKVVDRMARQLGSSVDALVGNATLSSKLNPSEFADKEYGLPTIRDIIDELAKPGRDPRREFKVAKFDDSVNKIGDLREGMVLEGVITNVTHFGAFVDVGVHQDGLIHVSQLSNEFVSDPSTVVSVGDVTRVKVLEVDVERKRISVTRKF
ncbi:MAG: Tex family protein [Aureliella sp.]